MRNIKLVVLLMVSFLLSGCSGPGLRMNVLGEQFIGSGWSAQARNNMRDFKLINPTLNGRLFANGTSKKPIPVVLAYGEECRAPLPAPVERYAQYVEFRFDVVTNDGEKLIGFVSKKYTIPSEYGGNYHRPPITFPVWAVSRDDVIMAD